MASREALSEGTVKNLPIPDAGNKLHYFSGDKLQGKQAPAGFAVRVTSAGTKSFAWFHRVDGKPYLETLGRWKGTGGNLSVLDAILEADKREKAIRRDGADPRPSRTRTIEDGNKAAGVTVSGLLDDYVKRYVEKEAKLRSADTIKRTFERLVKPAIGKIGIYDLRRSHVRAMLDDIDDGKIIDPDKKKAIKGGPVMADRTLGYLRKAFNWGAVGDDDFRSPIVKGMARTKPKERAGKRVLIDEEIRDLWAALDETSEPACYADYVRFLLCTGLRRAEASGMRWDELSDDDILSLPDDEPGRSKTKSIRIVPLTAAARKLLGKRPKDTTKHPFVFSTTEGKKPFSGYSKAKRLLDKKIAELRKREGRKPMAHWRPHDLRRTARTLMSRAGIAPDHAERCLGHIVGGVRGVYDRHGYLDEKKKAFEALDALLDRILKPADNVAELGDRRKAAG